MRALILGVCASLLLCGCPRLSTPESACEGFFTGLTEGDSGATFENLLESTQWAFATVQKNHRRMRELIETSYPKGEQGAALSRLYGADADSGRDLWSRLYGERYAQSFSERQGDGTGAIKVTPSEAHPTEKLCGREGKKPFRLARAASGRWGVADIDSEWEQAQLRAVHDLETIKKNADLYRAGGQAPSQK